MKPPLGVDDVAFNMNGRPDFGTWSPVDLTAIADGFESGEMVGPRPGLLQREDGVCLIYPGQVHSLSGEPESGKGWISLQLVAELVNDGQAVLYLDFEDSPQAIYARLRALGASRQAVLSHFHYVQPEEPPSAEALDAVIGDHVLVVLDGVSEAYSLVGLNTNDNGDATAFLRQVVRPLATNGAAVLELDHVTKAKDGRGRYSLGAQHKLAGVAVAYTTDVIKPPSRLEAGLVKLRVEKDRHGHVRGHAQGKVIAEVRITPFDDGERVRVSMSAPESMDNGPTFQMRRIADLLTATPGLMFNEIDERISGRREWKRKAVDALIQHGYVAVRSGANGAQLHVVVKPYAD